MLFHRLVCALKINIVSSTLRYGEFSRKDFAAVKRASSRTLSQKYAEHPLIACSSTFSGGVHVEFSRSGVCLFSLELECLRSFYWRILGLLIDSRRKGGIIRATISFFLFFLWVMCCRLLLLLKYLLFCTGSRTIFILVPYRYVIAGTKVARRVHQTYSAVTYHTC